MQQVFCFSKRRAVLLLALLAVVLIALLPGRQRVQFPVISAAAQQAGDESAAEGLTAEQYQAAREQMRRMPRYATALNRTLAMSESAQANQAAGWTELGPGNSGGRALSLVIHPALPDTMYIGMAAGGIWKTVNGGASWTPLMDAITSVPVTVLAMDPVNPDVIYAGTGESFADPQSRRGVGIFKTIDGGTTWTHLTSTGTPDYYYVNDIAISPRNNQRIYAATTTGIWRSDNGGASWTQVWRESEFGRSGGCQDLVIRTDQVNDFVFAACGTSSAAIWRNSDAGGAGIWAPVFYESGMGRTRLAIAPSNQNIIYALAAYNGAGGEQSDSRLLGVFRSDASGDENTWRGLTGTSIYGTPDGNLNHVLLSNPLLAFYNQCGLGTSRYENIGWYAGAIAVDPVDPERVWVGGVDLFRSDDGGRNWGLTSYWWADSNSQHYVERNIHAILFHPQYNGTTNRAMLAASDGGVFRTSDARSASASGLTAACNPNNTAVSWQSLNGNLNAAEFFSGAVTASGQTWVGGSRGRGLWRGAEAAGRNGWEKLGNGDVRSVLINPVNPDILYTIAPMVNNASQAMLRKSTDGGLTFTSVRLWMSDFHSLTSPGAPLLLDPSDPQRLWLGTALVWRSDKSGTDFVPVGGTFNGGPTAITVAPTDSNRALVGTNQGYIYRTQQALSSDRFLISVNTRLRDGSISSLAFDPANEEIAYATCSAFGGTQVWKSVDAGATWTGIDGSGTSGLPDVPINCLAVDPASSARLFVGSDVGLFVSTDGGATWAVESGLPRVPVSTLVFNTVGGVTSLYAFTQGRGAWRVTTSNQGCQFQLASASQSFAETGGDGSIGILAETAACNRAAKSHVEWITITAGEAGQGAGQVRFTVTPNRIPQARIGTINAAGRSFVVRQAAAVDHTPPVISITSPTAAATFKTTLPSLTLAGTAADNGGLSSISVYVDGSLVSPQYVRVTGTTNWTTTAIPVRVGFTKLTVTAVDTVGNSASATLTIINQPEYLLFSTATVALPSARHVAFDAAGNLYVTTRVTLHRITPSGLVSAIAGTTFGFGGDGGPALEARFNDLFGLAVDQSGNIFVADQYNHRIRKITPNGIVNTVAGSGIAANGGAGGFGGDGGPATAARLNLPQGLALDDSGNLYIADTGNHRVRKLSPDGVITTIAGNGGNGSGGDGGPATAAEVALPLALTFDAAGNLYISSGAGRIRKVTPAGTITTVAGAGAGYSGDGGPATAALLRSPGGLVFDASGNLFIADTGNNAIRVVAGDGRIRTVARAATPGGMARDAAGNLYVAEAASQRVARLSLLARDDRTPPVIRVSKPTSESSLTAIWPNTQFEGTSSDNTLVTHVTWENDRGGSGLAVGADAWSAQTIPLRGGLNRLTFTAWDASGNSGSTQLTVNYRPIAAVSNFAGVIGAPGFSGDGGPARLAQFNAPADLAFDAAGNVYIADSGNHRIRKITPDGVIRTIAGSGELGTRGDGGPATAAELNEPRGLTVDATGNVYFADSLNHRVRRITPDGIISAVAGTGLEGFAGDNGDATSARLTLPLDVVIDKEGNLFIADTGNHRIRKVTPSGVITTVAGTGVAGDSSDDIPATEAKLNYPVALAFDPDGNLHIADRDNNRIRKINAQGMISRALGGDDSGDGIPATRTRLDQPQNLAFDAVGNLYVYSTGVRRVGRDGLVYTLYTPNLDAPNDGVAPNYSTLSSVSALAFDLTGRLYLADSGNHRIATLSVSDFPNFVPVSAANYRGLELAPDSIVAAFGTNLASATAVATTQPLPYSLAGTTVVVRDSLGATYPAQLFFASPFQVNFLLPARAWTGLARITITNSQGETTLALTQLGRLSPALFTANSDGQGVAAALALRVRADGSQQYEPVAVFDAEQNKYIARPIDFGPESDQVYLVLFGTGFRNLEALRVVGVSIGGTAVPVQYAGAQGGFAGLDQINVRLPRALAGRGEVEVNVTVEGKAANPVKVYLR